MRLQGCCHPPRAMGHNQVCKECIELTLDSFVIELGAYALR